MKYDIGGVGGVGVDDAPIPKQDTGINDQVGTRLTIDHQARPYLRGHFTHEPCAVTMEL